MYRDRARLHRTGYQHRVCLITDRMRVRATNIQRKNTKMYPTENIQLPDPKDPSIKVFELHKISLVTDFEALQWWKAR